MPLHPTHLPNHCRARGQIPRPHAPTETPNRPLPVRTTCRATQAQLGPPAHASPRGASGDGRGALGAPWVPRQHRFFSLWRHPCVRRIPLPPSLSPSLSELPGPRPRILREPRLRQSASAAAACTGGRDSVRRVPPPCGEVRDHQSPRLLRVCSSLLLSRSLPIGMGSLSVWVSELWSRRVPLLADMDSSR
jgi:hypothetical protein